MTPHLRLAELEHIDVRVAFDLHPGQGNAAESSSHLHGVYFLASASCTASHLCRASTSFVVYSLQDSPAFFSSAVRWAGVVRWEVRQPQKSFVAQRELTHQCASLAVVMDPVPGCHLHCAAPRLIIDVQYEFPRHQMRLMVQCWGLLVCGFAIQAHAITPWRDPAGAIPPPACSSTTWRVKLAVLVERLCLTPPFPSLMQPLR